MTYRGLISTTALRPRGKVSDFHGVCWRTVNDKKPVGRRNEDMFHNSKSLEALCKSVGVAFFSSVSSVFFLSSLRPAVFRSGRNIWALTQLVVECCAVHLQRVGSAARPGAMETPPAGQQGRLLRKPIPGLLITQLCHPGLSAVSQMENSHRGVWWQHRWRHWLCLHGQQYLDYDVYVSC